MSRVTRKEFAAICKTTRSNVNVYVSRGKVLVDEDGLIDTEEPLNKMACDNWLKLYQEKEVERKAKEMAEQIAREKGEVIKDEPKKIKKKHKPGPKTKKHKNSKSNIASQNIVDDTARKKKADADLQEYKAAHEKLKMDKLAGKLIPVDLVFQILNIHNKSIFSTFQSDSENMASVYCEILAEGDRKKLAEIMDKLSIIINDNVNKAKDLAEIELENAIAEYSETLNRGQRK